MKNEFHMNLKLSFIDWSVAQCPSAGLVYATQRIECPATHPSHMGWPNGERDNQNQMDLSRQCHEDNGQEASEAQQSTSASSG